MQRYKRSRASLQKPVARQVRTVLIIGACWISSRTWEPQGTNNHRERLPVCKPKLDLHWNAPGREQCLTKSFEFLEATHSNPRRIPICGDCGDRSQPSPRALQAARHADHEHRYSAPPSDDGVGGWTNESHCMIADTSRHTCRSELEVRIHECPIFWVFCIGIQG